MTRYLDAPATRVFDAWLKPDTMRQWLFTSEGTNKLVRNEPYVGGTWEIIDHRDGMDYRAIGQYIEIDRPHRLVFTFKMPQFSETEDVITVELAEQESGCMMIFTQQIVVPHEENWSAEDIEKAIGEYRSESEHGWDVMFHGLASLVAASSTYE